MSGRSWPSRDRPFDALAGLDRTELLAWGMATLALFWAALTYHSAYHEHFAVRYDPDFPQWWQWSDQGRYYQAAKAWANLSLDPSQHWYFAGYPLLGAALFRLAPGHPFYLVDLACLLLTGFLLMLLASRLAASPAAGMLIGAATFILTVVLPPYAMKSFVEPWTTTPTAPLTLASLLLAFRFWDRPTAQTAFGLGLATASVLLFRPIDAVPLGLTVAGAAGSKLRSPRIAAAGLAGSAIPVVLAAATYVAIFGLQQSPYLRQSSQTGFEWWLVPLRWVTIFVSPQPEFRDEFSLAQTFPWIIPGVAGMAASLIGSRGAALVRHALVISAVVLHCLFYLAYRDLHPQGLFRFGNYHYFKWCLPVFGLYAAFLITEILFRRRLFAFVAGLVVATVLFSWRMTWQDVPAPWLADAKLVDAHTLLLPQPPRSVYDGLFVPAEGGPAQIYLSSYEMRVGDRVFVANADFKAFPTDGGLIFTVLRPMPAAPASIAFSDRVRLLPGPLQMKRAHLFWRWPQVVEVVTFYYRRWLHAE